MASWKGKFGRDGYAGGRARDGEALLRVPVDAVVTFDCGSGVVEATAIDVSENGLKIELPDPPPKGPISIKMIGLPTVSAEVRWRSGTWAGIRFVHPLPRDFLNIWVGAHGFRRA